MQKLVAVAELHVKQHRGDDAESREHQRRDPRLVTDKHQKPAAQFDRDGERQQLARHAERPHIGLARRIGGELGVGLVQEDRREQEAADEARRPLPFGPATSAQLTLTAAFDFGAAAMACSRSSSSSQPLGQSFFSSTTFSRALSTCPVST